MARTGTKEQVGSALERTTTALAQLGSRVDSRFSEEDRRFIFRSIAPACKDPRDQWLYLTTCLANGLSPYKRELYAIPRTNRKTGHTAIIFVTSYHVFVSRARQAGWVVKGETVCENDKFDGWDAAHDRPINHVIDPKKRRGEILGAYGIALHLKTGQSIGHWWPYDELALNAQDNPMFGKMPHHMTKRVAILRMARFVAPDLASLYGAEEFGVTVGGAEDKEMPPEVIELVGDDPLKQVEAQIVMPDDPRGADAKDVTPKGAPPPEDHGPYPVEATAEGGEAAGDDGDDEDEDEDEEEEYEVDLIDDTQRMALVRALAEAGYRTKNEALGFLSRTLNRPVETTADVDVEELETVNAILRGEVPDGEAKK